jgi:hypothetical protein
VLAACRPYVVIKTFLCNPSHYLGIHQYEKGNNFAAAEENIDINT